VPGFTPSLLQGGSEESGSTKARIDKAKKLADYDRRVLESKENIAVWITQIKAIVEVSGIPAFLHSPHARFLLM
jgi:hypothetical protein